MFMKINKNKKYTNRFFRFLNINKELITVVREIITIAPAIGFIVGSFILYKYFDINNISQQQIDTFTILTISLNFLVLIGTLSGLLIISTVYTYTALKSLKDKKEVSNFWRVALFKITIFYVMFLFMSFADQKDHIKFFILLLFIVLIFFFIGVLYTYAENKFLEHNFSNSIIMSTEFALTGVPFVILSSIFIAIDKDNYVALGLIYIILLVLFSIPYMYMMFVKSKSNIAFTVSMFIIAIFVLFIVGSSFFVQRTVQILNIGAKPYSELILDNNECERLLKYKKIGYLCDENNTLKDMFGIWLVGDKPIFQKLRKQNTLSMPKADKNSTRIWLNRDSIQTVL